MAALFTASVRAPLVGVVLVAELTDAYPALLAITLSTAMASLTAAALGGRPLYEMLLERTLRLAAVSSAWSGGPHRRTGGESCIAGRSAKSAYHPASAGRGRASAGSEAEVEIAQRAGHGDRADIEPVAEARGVDRLQRGRARALTLSSWPSTQAVQRSASGRRKVS